MSRTWPRLVLALLLLGPRAAVQAQTRPDFTGRWILEGGAPSAIILTIAQDGSTLTVTDPGSGPNRSHAYRLDGSNSSSTYVDAQGRTWTRVSECRWVGNALVVTTAHSNASGQKFETMTTYSLDYQSHDLVVTSLDTLKVQGPYMGAVTRSYRKS